MIITWSSERNRWEAITRGEEYKRLSKKEGGVGFLWDSELRRWHTTDSLRVKPLLQFCDTIARERVLYPDAQRKRALAQSRADSTHYRAPAPEGMEPYAYQHAGVEYAIQRKNTLFGDEMGLGKSAEALLTVNTMKDAKNVLIICPASLKINWSREAQMWLTGDHWKIGIAEGDYFPTEANVCIINFDILDRHTDVLRARGWDALIVDEAHYLRNGTRTIRGRQVFGHREIINHKRVWAPTPLTARRVMMLTGTPQPNKPRELWPLIHYLWPERFDDWRSYVTRYCAGYQDQWGWHTDGANLDALPELNMRLREAGLIRRLKSQVLKDLPPKIWQVNVIPKGDVDDLVRQEHEAWEHKQEVEFKLRAAVELAKASPNPDEYKAAIESLNTQVIVAFNEMARVRAELAVAKVPYVVEHVKNAIQDPQHKVIVMGYHREGLEAIKKAFGAKAVIVYGGMTTRKKQAAVDAFQNDPKVQVFAGQVIAAGVGYNLTASSHVIFPEMSWVPADNQQAEDRAHRIGQTRGVQIEYMVFEDSLDCTVAQRNVQKMRIAQKTLDENPEENALHVAQELGIAEAPSHSAPPATAGITRRQIQIDAGRITPVQEKATIEALKILAVATREFFQDKQGFNRYDRHIGRDLAARAAQRGLTKTEAALGLRLAWRYRGQLPPDLVGRLKAAV